MNELPKQKILYVITKSNFGGAQRYVYDLATHIPKDQFDAVVALGGTGEKGAQPGKLHTSLNEADVRTITVKHFMRNMSLMNEVAVFFELWKLIRMEKPDVLHASSSKAGGLSMFIGRLARVPILVFTSHGLPHDETWRPWWQRILMQFFTWYTILLSTKTILISSDNYTRVRHMPFVRNKATLLYNGISIIDFHTQQQAREKLLPNVNDGNSWIGSIAEYHPNKNLSVLIKALPILAQKGIHPHLVLIGEEGEDRTLLEKTAETLGIQDQVHLLGPIKNAAQYLKALNVFTLPSKKEGLPYVLLEAGAAQLPVVASNIPGNAEIIENNVSGILTDATPEALAEALHTLLTDKIQADNYAKALHEKVVSEFSATHMIKETLSLYSSSKPSIS